MAKVDHIYKELMSAIYNQGYDYADPRRKGVNRREITQASFSVPLDTFPAITLKRLYWKGVVAELLWFLSGATNIKRLDKNAVQIWNKDCYALRKREGYKGTYEQWLDLCKAHDYAGVGELGPVYGAQWRSFGGVDQITKLVDGLRNNPMGSEHLATAWNPSDLKKMALPPCHYEFQVVPRPLTWAERVKLTAIVDNDVEVDHELMDVMGIPKHGMVLVWSQRSVDTFLGLPFNIASYALLAHILAKMANMVPLGITGNLKKVHLYDNSFEETEKVLELDVDKYSDIKLEMADTLNFEGSIDEFLQTALIHDFSLRGYQAYPAIKVEMLSRDS